MILIKPAELVIKGHPRKAIIAREDQNGCYICTSHRSDTGGYPAVKRNGKHIHLSRLLYEDTHGPIGDNMVIRHTCDNPGCINIRHLVPGSHQDNMNDMVRRGRSLPGSKQPRSKFTPEQVQYIRTSPKSNTEIANEFGVTQPAICWIRKGKRHSSPSTFKIRMT